MAETIEMPFGLRTWVGAGNHVLDWGPDPPMERGKFWGEKGRPIVKYKEYTLRRLHGHLCENDWSDRDVFWTVGSNSRKESWIRWG